MTKGKMILIAGLVSGTLDILSAFIYVYLKSGRLVILNILKFIASGIFGKSAFAGGTPMALAGLGLHYVIAFVFTLLFFQVYPNISFFFRHKILAAIGYGLFVWIVMNLVVVPLSNVAHRPFNVAGMVINMTILILCIGIPNSFIAHNWYRTKNEASANRTPL